MEFKPQTPGDTNKNNIEKQAEWNAILSKVDQIRDNLNMPVDPAIKEGVAAFIANGFNTYSSCEGHLDRGKPFPYISFSHVLDSPEFKVKIADLFEQAKAKGYETPRDIPQSDKELYPRFIELRNESHGYKQETEAKIKSLLSAFYSSHTPSSKDFVLKPWEGGSFFAIESVSAAGTGLDNWKKFDEKVKLMTPQEKESYLRNSQAEMKAFTLFLKDKFLKDTSI